VAESLSLLQSLQVSSPFAKLPMLVDNSKGSFGPEASSKYRDFRLKARDAKKRTERRFYGVGTIGLHDLMYM
jgi:hypothetical protein